MKPILLHGQPIGGPSQPVICTPLVGRTAEAVLEELRVVLPKRPDVIEWRADWFGGVDDAAAVVQVASRLKAAAGGTPILFTCRAVGEGGEPVPIDVAGVVKLHAAVCAARCVDIIDCELSRPAEDLAHLRQLSRANDVAMIMSFHDFQSTPDAAALLAKFMEAERRGADMAKVSVMPRSPGDLLALLEATWRASKACRIPLIAIAMGGLGAVSRMVGGVFGSALTFAVGKSSSAPGQIAIEDLRAVLATVEKASAGS